MGKGTGSVTLLKEDYASICRYTIAYTLKHTTFESRRFTTKGLPSPSQQVHHHNSLGNLLLQKHTRQKLMQNSNTFYHYGWDAAWLSNSWPLSRVHPGWLALIVWHLVYCKNTMIYSRTGVTYCSDETRAQGTWIYDYILPTHGKGKRCLHRHCLHLCLGTEMVDLCKDFQLLEGKISP